jgi:hypothetical protein
MVSDTDQPNGLFTSLCVCQPGSALALTEVLVLGWWPRITTGVLMDRMFTADHDFEVLTLLGKTCKALDFKQSISLDNNPPSYKSPREKPQSREKEDSSSRHIHLPYIPVRRAVNQT